MFPPRKARVRLLSWESVPRDPDTLNFVTLRLRKLIGPASFPSRYFTSRRSLNRRSLEEARMATPDARTTERDGAGNIFLFYRDTDL